MLQISVPRRAARLDYMLAGALAAASFVVYRLAAVWSGAAHGSPYAYFPELASSFLHGRLTVDTLAGSVDLTPYHGHWYVPFPPLPALLMLPLVAILGPQSVDASPFSCVVMALGVGALYLAFESLRAIRAPWLSRADSSWLAIAVGFGSVAFYICLEGSVWHVEHVCSLLFSALALWSSCARRPMLAGALLGCAMLSRPSVAPTALLLVAVSGSNAGEGVKQAVRIAVPMAISIALMLGYNMARFINPLDFGYATANVAPGLAHDLARYGQFSPHFVPKNLEAMLTELPSLEASPRAGQLGLSVFFTSPALLLLFALPRSRVVAAGLGSIAITCIPLLMYYNTGAAQFGYRFSLDFMIPAAVLLAYAAKRTGSLLLRCAILFGVAINLWGVAQFYAQPLELCPLLAVAVVGCLLLSRKQLVNREPAHAVQPPALDS